MTGIAMLMAGDRPRIALTSGTSWTVPAGLSEVTIYCIGPGGDGDIGGGGGGAIAIKEGFAVTPGASISYQIGSPGTADTWFDSVATVLAATGQNASGTTGGVGGQDADCVGDTVYSGGDGGDGNASGSGGAGGGAAGVSGAGNNGAQGYDSQPGPGGGGVGGGSSTGGSNPDGGLGPAGTDNGGGGDGNRPFTSPFNAAEQGSTFRQWFIEGVYYGPGGGGGAQSYLGGGGGADGGTYGGGGGGKGSGTVAGSGGQGLIVIEF